MLQHSLDFANANGVWAFVAFSDFELDCIAVSDFSCYFRDVNEEVCATFDLNKSESFCLIKPLNCTLRHDPASRIKYLRGMQRNDHFGPSS